jgi:hypothetical protein
MRNHVHAAWVVPLVLFWTSSGWCQVASESALGDPTPAAVQDPSLSNSQYFPPSEGTAGVAAIGPVAQAGHETTGHASNCSASNPCALPTPARDNVTVAQPKP